MNSIILKAILLSMLPIAELRGGIPYAIANDVNPFLAYFICVGSNILAVPIVFLFLELLHPLFLKVSFYQKLFDKSVLKTRKKLDKKIKKYGFWGLMLFVMIPLPVTGAYTGSFAAWLFNIPKKNALLSVALGVMISGILVTTIWLFGSEVVKSMFIKKL